MIVKEWAVTQQRSEETRARILEAALDRFARYGYDATGVAEICRAAGVSKGAFYHHFPSKQAAFLELMDRWLESIEQQLAGVQAEAGTTPEALTEMAGMMGSLLNGASEQLPMFLEFWSKAARDPVVGEAMSAPYQRYQAFFCRLIEAGVEEGSLHPVDPEIAGQVLVSLAVGLALQGLVGPRATDWDQVVQRSMQMLLAGWTRS